MTLTFLVWAGGFGQAGLVLHLPFDRDGQDASGGNHNAMANNGAGISRTNALVGAGAAVFQSKGAYFQVPMFNPVTGNHPRSVSFWLLAYEPSSLPLGQLLLGWGDPGLLPRVRFDIGLDPTNDHRLRVEFNADAMVSTADTVNFRNGEWHHVLLTYDGKYLRFFVNGRPYGEALPRTVPLATGESAGGVAIGAGVREASGRFGAPERHFTGWMDDVGIWDEALNDVDAALLHGLARVGGTDLRWLPAARELWASPPGTKRRLGGVTWQRVSGLPGRMGDWLQAGEPNGAGSFIVLNEAGEGLQVRPHWWESVTLHISGLVIALLAFTVLAAWAFDRMSLRMRLRRLEIAQRAEAERRRISQDLHDDLGARVTEIILLGEKARAGDPGQAQSLVGTITEKAHQLVTALDEVVWTVNPENDSLPNLADYLSGYTQEFLQNAAVRCRLEVATDLPPAVLPARVRRNVLSAVKEALNNAVRHAGAGEIRLSIRPHDGGVTIAVTDDGKGFDPAARASAGCGLANMRERIEAVGGRLALQSAPGAGTTVSFHLPLQPHP